jgi:AbiU2
MKFNNPQEQLVYYLNNGIVQDIYKSRLSYSLLMAIGRNGKALEGSRYERLFQSLQMILSDHVIVYVTKLFEGPDGPYEVISIPTTLQFIKKKQQALDIIERPLVCQELIKLGIAMDNACSLSSQQLTQIIVDYFSAKMPLMDNDSTLQALKLLRNKRIAHRDAIDLSDSPTTTFGEAFNLIRFAHNFLVITGAAYTSTLHGFVNGDFFVGRDAEENSRALDHLVSAVLRGSDPFAA